MGQKPILHGGITKLEWWQDGKEFSKEDPELILTRMSW